MRRSSWRRSNTLTGLGLIALTCALIAIPYATRNQSAASTPEHAVAAMAPAAMQLPVQPAWIEHPELEPAKLGYVEFDWDPASGVPGFDARRPSANALAFSGIAAAQ